MPNECQDAEDIIFLLWLIPASLASPTPACRGAEEAVPLPLGGGDPFSLVLRYSWL